MPNTSPRPAAHARAVRDYSALSTVRSIVKDLHIIQDAGRTVGAILPFSSAVNEYYKVLVNAGFAGEDLTALARILALPKDRPSLA